MFAAAGAFAIAIAIALAVTQLNQTPLSADLPSRAFGDLSLIPALLPGPLAMAASVPGRVRRRKPTPEMQAIMNSNAEANAALAVHGRENYDAIINDAATFQTELRLYRGLLGEQACEEGALNFITSMPWRQRPICRQPRWRRTTPRSRMPGGADWNVRNLSQAVPRTAAGQELRN